MADFKSRTRHHFRVDRMTMSSSRQTSSVADRSLNTPASGVFIGDGTLLVRCVEAWLECGGVVSAIATNDPVIAAYAARHHWPLAPVDSALEAFMQRFAFDYLFSASNLHLLPGSVLRCARKMAINFHDGPLPMMAGLNVPLWAVLQGHDHHAITWHEMTDGIDAGRVLVTKSFEIEPHATTFDVNARCWTEGIAGFEEMADALLQGREVLTPQSLEGRAYYAGKKRPARACAIDPSDTVENALRLSRALNLGPGANPIGLLRLPYIAVDVTVGQLQAVASNAGAPGTMKRIPGGVELSLRDGVVALTQLSVSGREPLAEAVLPDVCSTDWKDAALATAAYERAAASEKYWVKALAACEALELAFSPSSSPLAACELSFGVHDRLTVASAFFATLSRLASRDQIDLVVEDAGFSKELEGLPFLSVLRPLSLNVDLNSTLTQLADKTSAAVDTLAKKFTFATDLLVRMPELRQQNLPDIELCLGETSRAMGRCRLRLVLGDQGRAKLISDAMYASSSDLDVIAHVLAQILSAPAEVHIGDIPLLDERGAGIIAALNKTTTSESTAATIPMLFSAQVEKTPHRVAVRAHGRSLTYLELDQRSNQLAHYLRKRGVGPDTLVGAYLDRDIHTMVGLLAIQKAGGAYVPLDPHYPRDRVAYMLQDSGAAVVVTSRTRSVELEGRFDLVCVDEDVAWRDEPPAAVQSGLQPHHLAYAIYTSGSTGKPKGVLVEQRNATNFFVAMDGVVTKDAADPTWLAVTSLSFDISVLELFYTLCRGYTVVMYSPPRPKRIAAQHGTKSIELSLFYFSSDVGEGKASYELLIEGAKFADENGFAAVWTPERHFHAFGGLFPNSAVTLSALSQITRRVRLCSGSLVSPLHHPARIAEDFALLDNLSNGRVGVSFAAGWQPNDFVFAPQNFANRRDVMLEQLAQVRKLWNGEAVDFVDGNQKTHAVKTLPRPVQKPIPVWLTAAANPDTFRAAAERGCFLLTHLLGQTLEEVGEKVALYRRVWQESGHPGNGHVTIMLHTFVGEDAETVKNIVREPMKRYLRSAMDLVQKAAWSFPTFKQMTTSDGGKFTIDHLEDKDVDVILDYSFERYYESSGLFGTAERALTLLDKVKGIGIDEVACLIDFGIDVATVIQSLPLLAEVRRESMPEIAGEDASVGELLRDNGVTHFQCTPSMAGMLLEDKLAIEGLRRLKQMFVGGEALPAVLGERLAGTVSGRLTNMYGPTETTVWSTSFDVTGKAPITIGKPIANNYCFALDARKQPVPFGWPGELFISGDGVVRGYHQRPLLTDERFVEISTAKGKQRAYRTGDLVRFKTKDANKSTDAEIDFLGRIDHQVKIRGHRIELGEIEAALERQPGVQRAVVVAQEQQGDKRLVAYVEGKPEADRPNSDALRTACRHDLPDFMVPAVLMVLDRLPLTPNGKIDRKRLPAPEVDKGSAPPPSAATLPANDAEEKIATLWAQLLGRERVGRTDNFFDLGGHSLLAVQVTQKLREIFARDVALLDLFRHPTVEKLAKKIAGEGEDETALKASTSRADARLAALKARGRGRT